MRRRLAPFPPTGHLGHTPMPRPRWTNIKAPATGSCPSFSYNPYGQAALAYDSARRVSVLFGGSYSEWGATWEWNGTDWKLVAVGLPRPRHRHAMVYDGLRRAVVIFGGESRSLSGFFDDAWSYSGPVTGDLDSARE